MSRKARGFRKKNERSRQKHDETIVGVGRQAQPGRIADPITPIDPGKVRVVAPGPERTDTTIAKALEQRQPGERLIEVRKGAESGQLDLRLAQDDGTFVPLDAQVEVIKADGTVEVVQGRRAQTVPTRRAHWRDALDGLIKIQDYWAEADRLGMADGTYLGYGRGWDREMLRTDISVRAEELGITVDQAYAVIDRTRRNLRAIMGHTVPIYIAPTMVDLIEQAADTIPPTVLTADLLPVKHGMLWFGRELDYCARADDDERARHQFGPYDILRGALVSPSREMRPPTRQHRDDLLAAGSIDTRPQLRSICWHPLARYSDQVDGVAPDETRYPAEKLCVCCYFDHTIPPGFPLDMFDFAQEFSFGVGYGEILNPALAGILAYSRENYAAPGSKWITDILMTTLLFMRQRLVAPEVRTVENKGARKSLTKDLGRAVPDVTVYTLREYQAGRDDLPGDADGARDGRQYRHSWMVDGHWHRYRHGRGKAEVKTIFLAPYVKQKDKPFLAKQRVINVAR